MVITCPACQASYRINPTSNHSSWAKVKCPDCSHVFNVSLLQQERSRTVALSGQPVVLIVDDARFFREMIKEILKDLPVELIDSADGNDAWQKISTLVPRLVLLDLNIPGKSGREILSTLQQTPQLEDVKVLVMSGVERGEETASEVRLIGAEDFISKSFKPSELQERVREILDL